MPDIAAMALPSMGGYCVEDQDKAEKALPPDIHEELVKKSEHGVFINGVISWVLVQKETNPPEFGRT